MKKYLARLFSVGQTSRPVDVALLMLRIMVMSSLIYHHGADKIPDWNWLTHKQQPLDPIGIGVVPSLLFATFADLICGSLILIGFATRITSFFCAICVFAVVFFISHALAPPFWPLQHEGHGELAWLYLAVCLCIMIVGPGRYSLDCKLALFQGKRHKAAITNAD
jgi:putative oxidoreductase